MTCRCFTLFFCFYICSFLTYSQKNSIDQNKTSQVIVLNTSQNHIDPSKAAFYIEENIEKSIDLTQYSSIFTDSTRELSNDKILSNLNNFDFNPLSSFEFEEKYTRGKYAYWLLYNITNKHNTEIELGIDLGVFDSIQTYIYSDNILIQKALSGNRVNPKSSDYKKLSTYFHANLKPGQSYLFLSRITNEIEINREINPQLINPLNHESNLFSRFMKIYGIQSAFLAILLIVSIINFFQFLFNKEKAFLFYSLYILFVSVFFIRDFYCTSPIILFEVSDICKNTYISPIMIVNFILYILFIMTFLETKKKEPRLHKVLLFFSIPMAISYSVVERIIDLWDPYLAWKLYGYFKIVSLFLNLFIIFLIAKIKNPLSYFIIMGSLSLIITSIITSFMSFRQVHFVNYFDTTYIPQYIGILLELIFFSIGLGYKTRITAYERRKAASELVLKNQEIAHEKELKSVRSRFFTHITHEFRTPLTLIKGPIEQLEQFPEGKLSVSNVKMIRRNANRLLNLVNQLLDLSKLETKKLQLETTEGNVYKCLRAAASSFSSHAAQRNMDYQIKIPSNEILWASFDRDKLEKIVYNLLSNAFKFTENGTTVSIYVKFLENQLKIDVIDTGSGIPPNKLPYIFDRFFQVDDSFTKEKEGTGVGLALTKELIELMEGTIHVESEYKKGSVFKVDLPFEEIKNFKKEDKEIIIYEEVEVEEMVLSPSKLSKPVSKKQNTILIIEDNSDMRSFIQQQLVEEYQIIEAHNGEDGLEKAIKKIPNLIITDLMMPKMDGITLSKHLKTDIHTSHIPVIMLTAKSGMENKIEGLETGADAYLTKPFNAKELQVQVKNLIKQRQKLRELFSKGNIVNPKEVTLTSLDEQFLQKTLDLLEEQFSYPNFGIPQMREKLAMSNAQLHRKIKAITNQSPGELLRVFRLKRAAQILKQKGENVTEVAYMVGFNNLSYFAKCFKEFHGVSPSTFNKNNS